MADIYGMKVSKQGYDVKTATDTQLNFDSRFDTLKIKQQGTGIIYDSARTITIAHNLGYVPTFTVHIKPSSYADGYYISPIQVGQSFFSPPSNVEIFSWADNMNIYIKAQNDAGWQYFYTNMDYRNYQYDGAGQNSNGICVVGKFNADGMRGSMRFPGIQLNKNESFYKASLGFYINARTGLQSIPLRVRAVDEDNTSYFPDSADFGRPLTDAYVDASCDSGLHNGDVWAIDVNNLVSEVISRNNWSSGNALAFQYDENNCPNGNNMQNSYDEGFYNSYSWLKILRSSIVANIKYTIFYNKIV